jgi:hypothetical protein
MIKESKREARKRLLRKRLEQIESHLFKHETQIQEINDELDALEEPTKVQVVYLNAHDQSPLRGRAPYTYFDGTPDGLEVGDRVVAETIYGDRVGIVVQVGGPSNYRGPLSTITSRLPR